MDFGDYDVRITVPADHIVASTGELQNMMEVLTKQQIDRYKKSRSASSPMIIISQDEAIINEKSRSKKLRHGVIKPRTLEILLLLVPENLSGMQWVSN